VTERILRAVVVTAALGAAGCAAPSTEWTADPGLQAQIEKRIAAMEYLKGADLSANIEYLGGQICEPAVPAMVEAMRSSPSSRVRAGCASALGTSQDPRAIEPLARVAREDQDPGVRYTAAFALCRFRDIRGLPVLFEALKSEDVDHRRDAETKLRYLTRLDFGYDPEAPAAEREPAVARWEAWYREAGPQRAAMALVAPQPR